MSSVSASHVPSDVLAIELKHMKSQFINTFNKLVIGIHLNMKALKEQIIVCHKRRNVWNDLTCEILILYNDYLMIYSTTTITNTGSIKTKYQHIGKLIYILN